MCNAACLFAVDGVTLVECRFEQRRKRAPNPTPAEGADVLNFFLHDANAEKRTTRTLKDNGKAATTDATGEVPSSPCDEVGVPIDAFNAHASFRNSAVIRL